MVTDYVVNMSGFGLGVVFTFLFIFLTIAVISRSVFPSILLILAAGTLIALRYDPLTYAMDNWLELLERAAIFLAIGAAWSVVAWYVFLRKVAKRYDADRVRFLPEYLAAAGLTELTPDHFDTFRRFMATKSGSPASKNNLVMSKSALAYNIFLWPIAIIEFFLGDALQLFVDAFVRVFGGLFRRIQAHVFRKFPELSN